MGRLKEIPMTIETCDILSDAEAEVLTLPDLVCPMPVLRAKKTLARLAAGAKLRVESTAPRSEADLAEFCRQTGHALLGQAAIERDGRTWFVTLIARKDD